MSLGKKALLVVLSVILIDQIVKIYIKTHFNYGDSKEVFSWFVINFIENPGMAFGWVIGGSFGKLALSIFRILAILAIGWYLANLVKAKANTGLIICVALILAGAIGNIIDSAFYGLIFDKGLIYDPLTKEWHSYYGIAHLGHTGYAGFLKGSVVDMLYFPIIQNGHFPQWLPIWGGESFIFFHPTFNIADSSISIGVASIVLFQKRFFKHEN
jgi:signal peptidase II